MPPAWQMLSSRAAMLTPSPKMSLSSTMMSPTLMPMRRLDFLVRRQIGIARRHPALDVDGATNRIDRAGEFHKGTVTGRFHDAAAMLRDLWVNVGLAQSFESSESALLIAAHQAAVADDVGREDCGEPSFDPSLGHEDRLADCAYQPSLWSRERCVYRGYHVEVGRGCGWILISKPAASPARSNIA